MKKLAALLAVGMLTLVACQPATPAAAPKATGVPKADTPASAPAASKQQMSIASDRVGGAGNTIATGLASVISGNTATEMSVMPIGDVSNWINLLENEEVEFGLTSMTSLAWAYQGRGVFTEPHDSFQLVQLGTPQTWGVFVPGDANVSTPEELANYLRGKRFSHRWANPVIDHYNRAAFANLGLTENDIQVVSSSTYDDYAANWNEGRLDASGATIGVGVLEQMYAARPFKFVSLYATPEAEARMREVAPDTYISRQEPGPRGVNDPIDTLTYDYGFIASKSVNEQTVYDIVAATYTAQAQLAQIHPLLAQWGPAEQRWVNPRTPIPYHPGAVRFYKEKGLWTPDMEAAQSQLLGN